MGLFRPLVVLGVVAAIAAVLRTPMSIGAHFMAKRHCSSFFLTGIVPVKEFGIPIFRVLPLWVSYGKNSVEVKLFGLIPLARAFFQGAERGCVLDQETPTDSCAWEQVASLAPPPLPERPDAAAQAIAEEYLHALLPNGEEVHGRALLVSHKGALVAETYRAPFGKNTLQHGWSMTKSLLNTLIGKRVYESKMKLSDAVLWPNNTHSKSLKIGHLLNMTSGLDWVEDYGPFGDPTQMLHHHYDMVQFVAARGVAYPPGQYWHYSSADSNLLGYQLLKSFSSLCEHRTWVRRTLAVLGLPGAVIESDAAGNFVWSRFGFSLFESCMLAAPKLSTNRAHFASAALAATH
jgi:hypothetical protein